jgi:hypothetical protein
LTRRSSSVGSDSTSPGAAAGYRVRFWATPDLNTAAREALWRELVAAGVDHIDTDELAGPQEFLFAEDPAEQAAPAA